ncbi:MAG TPA: Spy/CpxP family protein refolding chaperone [Vicinamibacteria bacterium]|nr:Spy/CpxP family protein refolding chaperone [Vicinamibacteria bacterium]
MVDTGRDGDEKGKAGGHRRRFWMAGGLVVAGLVALAAVAPRAWAYRALLGHIAGHGPHGFAHLLADPAAAKEHVGTAVEWALRGVNATDEQKGKARQVTDRLIDQLGPLVAQHREHHAALVRELAKPEIDRQALEQLRRQEIALADEASKALVGSLADLGDALTPEQRAELVALGRRLHGGESAH